MDPRLKLTALEKTLSALANIDLMPPVIVSEKRARNTRTANDIAPPFLLNGAQELRLPNTCNPSYFLFIEERG